MGRDSFDWVSDGSPNVGIPGELTAEFLRQTNLSNSCSSFPSRSPMCNGHGFSCSTRSGPEVLMLEWVLMSVWLEFPWVFLFLPWTQSQSLPELKVCEFRSRSYIPNMPVLDPSTVSCFRRMLKGIWTPSCPDSLVSKWYPFRTPNPACKSMHGCEETCRFHSSVSVVCRHGKYWGVQVWR